MTTLIAESQRVVCVLAVLRHTQIANAVGCAAGSGCADIANDRSWAGQPEVAIGGKLPSGLPRSEQRKGSTNEPSYISLIHGEIPIVIWYIMRDSRHVGVPICTPIHVYRSTHVDQLRVGWFLNIVDYQAHGSACTTGVYATNHDGFAWTVASSYADVAGAVDVAWHG